MNVVVIEITGIIGDVSLFKRWPVPLLQGKIYLLTFFSRARATGRDNNRWQKWRPACWHCASCTLPHRRKLTVACGYVGTVSCQLTWHARGATALWKSASTVALVMGSFGGALQNNVVWPSVFGRAVCSRILCRWL